MVAFVNRGLKIVQMSVKGMHAINDQIAAPSKRYGAREGSLKGSFQYEFYGNVSKWNKTSGAFEDEANFNGDVATCAAKVFEIALLPF